jgi:hypothetical protein
MTPNRPTRRRLAAVGAVAALPLLSACATFSPATTLIPYNASDGIGLQLGSLEAANLLVVGSEKGGEGVLSGALVNKGTQAVTVAVSTEGAPTPVTIDVPAQRMVKLTADGAATSAGPADAATVLVPSLAAPPGSVVTVQLATRAGGQAQVKVPVVAPQHEYATITPPPTTPAATQSPTGEPAPDANESAQPTTSPS